MEQSSPDADYFVQLNELYVKFKQVAKKINQAESEDREVIGDHEQENFEPTEWVEASKKLTDAILGCLDAKLEGLISTEPHYYRLLGMKSSILVDRSKILASNDEEEESFQVLDEALALMIGLPPRPETSYVTLRLINHFAYTLSVEERYAKAKRVLLEGERVYSQIDEDTIHAGYLASEELFAPECTTPVPRRETSDFLERLATNNVQMLGFVHGRLGDWTRFVSCGHLALRRQLECREGDALAWVARATRLAQNFLARSRYREARTHLAAASQVMADYELDLRSIEPDDEVLAKIAEVELRAGDLGRAWTKYALHLMDAFSKEDEDAGSSSSSSSESSSSSASEEGKNSGVEVCPQQDLQDAQDAQNDGDVVVEVAVKEEGECDDKTSDVQGQGDVIVEVAVKEKGESDDKTSDVQCQGDVVVEAVKVNDEVAVNANGEGDDKEQDVQVKFEKIDETEKDEEVEMRTDVTEITSEEAPCADEQEAVDAGKDHCCCLHVHHDGDGDADAGDDEEEVDDADDYVFPTLDLGPIFDAVPCEPVDTEDKAHALTQYVMSWSERAMRAFPVTTYPEMFAAAAMDHAEMMRYLAGYSPLDAAYLLHRTRCELLEQVCDSVKEASQEIFETVSCDLYRELADVQLELMTLNLRRLDTITEAYHSQGTVQEQAE